MEDLKSKDRDLKRAAEKEEELQMKLAEEREKNGKLNKRIG